MNTAPQTIGASSNPHRKRFGTIAAKIGTDHEHKIPYGLRAKNGRVHAPGSRVYFRIEDITRHPEADGHTHWVCRHAGCQGKTWTSKAAMLADHADNRELAKREETHLYYAVADIPEQPAVPEKIEKGRVMQVAKEAQPATILLLSDEE